MPKSDSIQTYQRVQVVMAYLLEGYTTAQIIAQCKAVFEVEERMAYNYVKKAFQEFKKAGRKNMEEKKGFYLAAKLNLYNKLKQKESPGGAAVALNILESMEKIDGVSVQRIDVTSQGQELKNLTEQRVIKATLKLN